MKKILSILVATVMVLSFTGCEPKSSEPRQTGETSLSNPTETKTENSGVVNIYNWTEYIPQEVYDKFESETGIRVVESAFSSNEELLSKLAVEGTNKYDILVPSSYIIPVLIEQDMLQKINKDNIPNYSQITPSVLDNPDYAIPYMATMTVVAGNKKKLAELGVEIKSLNDLLDPKLQNNLVVVDDSRELIGAALKATGKDPGTTDKATIEGTLPWLSDLKKNVKSFDSDSPKTLLATGEVAAGLVYNMDAGLAINENPDIDVIYTTEPCELAVDNFVITKTSQNKENAEKFINFIHTPEIYKMILDEYPCVCLNEGAKALLSEDYLQNNGSNVNSDELARAHNIVDVGDAAEYYDEVFTKMKVA